MIYRQKDSKLSEILKEKSVKFETVDDVIELQKLLDERQKLIQEYFEQRLLELMEDDGA